MIVVLLILYFLLLVPSACVSDLVLYESGIINHHHVRHHGLDRNGRLILSGVSTKQSSRHHKDKITGVIKATVLVETISDPKNVLTDINSWIPLLSNVTRFNNGFLLSISGNVPWYIVNMIESHEEVLAIHPFKRHKYKPGFLHASLPLIKDKTHHVTKIDFPWGNQIVTIGDSGIDYQHCGFESKDVRFYTYTGLNKHEIIDSINLDFARSDRIIGYVRMKLPLGIAETDFEDLNEYGGHGTHVSGIVAGGGCLGRMNKMKMLVFDLMKNGDAYLTLPPFFTDFLDISYGVGSRVMSNSWGDLESGKSYSHLAREMDDFLLRHDDYMIIQASGNDGIAGVHSPGHFKNGITVGAGLNTLESWIEYFPVDLWVRMRPEVYNEYNMFEFSSRGRPGGRVKPTIMAPGGYIKSAKSGGGTKLMMGTSQATPLVSWRFMIIQAQAPRNASSLVPMGIMISSASKMKGYVVDWVETGRLKLQRRIENGRDDGWGMATSKLNVNDWDWFDRISLDSGFIEYCFRPLHKNRHHAATLIWRDFPSWVGTEGGLSIDYDLRVVMPKSNTILHLDDHSNNIEKLEWRGGGDIRLQIIHMSPPRELKIPIPLTLVYSKNLKEVPCEASNECDEYSPGVRCVDGGMRVCNNGAYSNECFKLNSTREYLVNGTSKCFMSYEDKDCLNGGWVERHDHHRHHKKRFLSMHDEWSISSLLLSPGELVTRQTFYITIGVVVSASVLLLLPIVFL